MKKTSYYEFVHTPAMFGGRVPLPWSETYYSSHPDGIHMIPHDLGCYEWEHQAIEARNRHLLARFNAGEEVRGSS